MSSPTEGPSDAHTQEENLRYPKSDQVRHFPVLNWDDWSGPHATPETQSQFLEQIRDAAVGLGFFHLQNSPLDQGCIRQRLFDLSAKFFALNIEQRLAISMVNSPHFRGYSKFAEERTLGLVDNRDQIDFGSDVNPPLWTQLTGEKGVDPGLLPEFVRIYGPNQYVSDDVLPGHEETIRAWFTLCTELNDALTTAIEAALELKPGELLAFIGHPNEKTDTKTVEYQPIPGTPADFALPYARLKTIRYPTGQVVDGIARSSQAQGNGTQGVGAHRDGGWLTLLAVSDVPGLEVQDVEGSWLPVPQVENAIIVNFGQQFEVLTHGLVRAATHRVTVPDGVVRDRLSVAYFSTPALNAVMHQSLTPGDSVYDSADRARIARGGKKRSEVPENDLHAAGEPYGVIALAVLVRSHPDVVRRWYPWLAQ